ncbi:hypothetical protein HMPREF9065_01812 [Aggregatibacter sp. oral taxon 458 str. W10330]|nr:hypothetical protein HMPREF9065_01812 [Aggregatibacter sp. oral taxon 458 str. W10330]
MKKVRSIFFVKKNRKSHRTLLHLTDRKTLSRLTTVSWCVKIVKNV